MEIPVSVCPRSHLPFFCPHCIVNLKSTPLPTSTRGIFFPLYFFFQIKGSHFTREIPRMKEHVCTHHCSISFCSFHAGPQFFLQDTLSHCHPENTFKICHQETSATKTPTFMCHGQLTSVLTYP